MPGILDVARLAVGSFLARYREPTLTAYTQDLKAYLALCQTFNRDMLQVTRGELETYVLPTGVRRHARRRPHSGPNDHALVCTLGMLGLRVSEARGTDITDLRYEAGYELLHVLGKGAKPADTPLPIPVLRAVGEAVDGRTAGPILRTRTGRRMDRAGASRALTSVAGAAGIAHPISPHGLRHTSTG